VEAAPFEEGHRTVGGAPGFGTSWNVRRDKDTQSSAVLCPLIVEIPGKQVLGAGT
jgi:hypothetical protein